MNVEAHHAVRRLYVQLLRAQHGVHGVKEEEGPPSLPPGSTNILTNRNPLSAPTSLERSGASGTAAVSPNPTSYGAAVVISSAPPAPPRRLPRSAASPVTTTLFASRGASVVSNARPSRSDGLKGCWQRRRDRYSTSPYTAFGYAALGDEETACISEVQQWKMRLAQTLRQRSVKVEEQLREMLAGHVQQCLQAAATSTLTASAQQGTPARFSAPSVPSFLRVLSTGYAVTISVQNTSGVEDGVRDREGHDATWNPFSDALGSQAPGEDGTGRDANNPRHREDAYVESTREAAPKSPGIQAASLRSPASRLIAAGAPAAATSLKTVLLRKQSLEAQLKACQADPSQSWQSAGTPRNPFVPVNTAALCSRLNAYQMCAARTTAITDAPASASSTKNYLQEKESSEAPAAALPPVCTLWEYLPISSSLHANMSSAIGKEGKSAPVPTPSRLALSTSPMDRLKAVWRRCARKSSRRIPPVRSDSAERDKRAVSANNAAHDPLALMTDSHWRRLQEQVRATQDAFQLLLAEAALHSQDSRQRSGGAKTNTPAVMSSRAPPLLSAYAPISRALPCSTLEAEGVATEVVMVCYTAAPLGLDSVSWDASAHAGHTPVETAPSVSLQPTWALCFEVDALHEAWLRRTLLEVASKEAGPPPASIATASPPPPATFTTLGTSVISSALKVDVQTSLRSMCTCH
ncbi:hypothetical protein LPMP_231180 [Leishmania panamensis]|uniref:Uncharacterized protein n=1 Tax=Leishmania panamensis TaxID=5679 RepID=A0A088RRG4_LEIPA|nr:hypothetical protein LPMP_231180 [Leishmania panamensis]AIN98568.1 hypothetical protein LPMP_231180 [Leishmania panamensis]